MTTINVRGLPEETCNQLRELASEDGKSLNAEVQIIIEEGVQQRMIRRSREEAFRLADESRKRVGRIGVSTLELLHEGREER